MQLMVELSSSIADLKAAKVENKRLREYANSFKTLTDALRDYEKSFPPRREKRVRSVTNQCKCECESGESESD
jgi:hypothetical protein